MAVESRETSSGNSGQRVPLNTCNMLLPVFHIIWYSAKGSGWQH